MHYDPSTQDVDALQQALTQAEARASDLQRQLTEAHAASSNELGAARARVQELEDQAMHMQRRWEEQHHSQAGQDGALASTAARVEALEAELCTAKEAATSAHAALDASTKHAAQLQAELDAMQGGGAATAADAQRLLARAEAAEGALASQVDKWTRLLEEKDAEVAAQAAAAAEARARVEDAERRMQEGAAAAEARVEAVMADAEVCAIFFGVFVCIGFVLYAVLSVLFVLFLYLLVSTVLSRFRWPLCCRTTCACFVPHTFTQPSCLLLWLMPLNPGTRGATGGSHCKGE